MSKLSMLRRRPHFLCGWLACILIGTFGCSTTVVAGRIGWEPVSITVLVKDSKEDPRSQALSVLRDFSLSKSAAAATLERLIIILNAYGRLRSSEALPPTDAARALRATRLLNSDLSARTFKLRKDFGEMRSRLRTPVGDIDSEGALLADLIRGNALEMAAADALRAVYTSGGMSQENIGLVADLLTTSEIRYLLDPRLSRFNLEVDSTLPLWERVSLQTSSTTELSLEELYRPTSSVSLGSIAASVIPITLYGLSPVVLRHIHYPSMPDELRLSLPREIRVPVGFIVVRDLCLSCGILTGLPVLPLPNSSWSALLIKNILPLQDKDSMAIVGVAYETIQVDWRK